MTVRRGHANLQISDLPWPELPRVKETVVAIGRTDWVLHDARFSFYRSMVSGETPGGDVYLTFFPQMDEPLRKFDMDELEFEGFKVYAGDVDVRRLRLLRAQRPEILVG
jgi:hypothetical protein